MTTEEIPILTFRINDTVIGIEANSIAIVQSPKMASEGRELRYFHEMVPFKQLIGAYQLPAVILSSLDKQTTGLIVDQLETMRTIDRSLLQPIPPLMLGNGQMSLYLGMMILDGTIVFMMDLSKLLKTTNHTKDMPLPGDLMRISHVH